MPRKEGWKMLTHTFSFYSMFGEDPSGLHEDSMTCLISGQPVDGDRWYAVIKIRRRKGTLYGFELPGEMNGETWIMPTREVVEAVCQGAIPKISKLPPKRNINPSQLPEPRARVNDPHALSRSWNNKTGWSF